MQANKPNRHSGFAIVIAWPETKCKQAGGWYEPLMKLMGFNINGYYEVGHAAIILIDDQTKKCEYFDFGRYHAPHGFGRVRDEKTDHDLMMKTRAEIINGDRLENDQMILKELLHNKSSHGDGHISAATTRVNYQKSRSHIETLQRRTFLPYGPFAWNGSNCSRFVASALNHGNLSLFQKLRLNFQISLSASPAGNVRAVGGNTITVGKNQEEIRTIITEQALVTS
jgi:hypothetical protein